MEELYTEQNLFTRLTSLYTDAQVIKDDVKAVKSDYAYDADMNPKALSKDVIKLIDKAAKLYVAAKFEEVEEETLEVFEKYKALTKYEN